MLDIKALREAPDAVQQKLSARNEAADAVAGLIGLDSRRRERIGRVEALKAERNTVSAAVAQAKRSGGDATDLLARSKAIGDEVKGIDDELREIEAEQTDRLLRLPNLPLDSVPVGRSADDNVVAREELKHRRTFDFPVKDHLTLGRELGILDFERGAKIAGSGFPVYLRQGATLERALLNFMLDRHLRSGYEEVFPPFVVNETSLRGTGQLPKFAEDMYTIPEDGLFLIPTAEVPITNLHRDEILTEAQLPIRYCGYSACFRREAGSYGKDSRGFLRVHQFNKVELVLFTAPEHSDGALERLVRDVEVVLDALKIPHRVLSLCTGDLGFSSAKTYDIEVWSPAEAKYLEASSCSTFTDFQARRANIKFKRDPQSKPEFVHTLNGSGLATSRLMVALLETYQQADGSVEVPDVLRPYTGFDRIAPR